MTTEVQRPNEFLERAVADLAAGYGGVMVSLGRKLGLYRALAGAGPLSPVELARRAGCAERYVREWLNSQAAGGYVLYEPRSETYELTAEQAAVLADEDSPTFIPPAWDVPASMWLDEDKALDAFRSGRGIPWGAHDGRLFSGSAAFFRNAYRGNLVQYWLPALDGVQAMLEAGAHVADVGCGHGHSTIIMAQAYPRSRFFGYDSHPASVTAARENARHAGVGERASFEVATAQGYADDGFDLVCFFDCLHDLGDPVGAARHARERLTDGGTLLLVEPYAGDRLEDNLNPIGRLYYAASTTLCCAHSLSEEGGAALGAQAGVARLSEVLRAAGFDEVRVALETPFNLVLEARVGGPRNGRPAS